MRHVPARAVAERRWASLRTGSVRSRALSRCPTAPPAACVFVCLDVTLCASPPVLEAPDALRVCEVFPLSEEFAQQLILGSSIQPMSGICCALVGQGEGQARTSR